MELENTFAVPRPADEVFVTLLDVERVAGCLPGARVLERTGDASYLAAIRVKVGPISVAYQGELEIVEQDPQARRAVMSVRARESRGQGTAEARAVMTLSDLDGATHGAVHVDLQISGRVASLGQGAMQEVSSRLVDAFSKNLAAMLTEQGAADAAAGGGEGVGSVDPPPRGPQPSGPSDADALSATEFIAPVLARRLREPRAIAACVLIVALAGFLAGRRSRGQTRTRRCG